MLVDIWILPLAVAQSPELFLPAWRRQGPRALSRPRRWFADKG